MFNVIEMYFAKFETYFLNITDIDTKVVLSYEAYTSILSMMKGFAINSADLLNKFRMTSGDSGNMRVSL